MAIFLTSMGINNNISGYQSNQCNPCSIRILFIVISLIINLRVFAQRDNSNWLKDLPDSISIADINLPGAHDAVACNKHANTPYSCHSTTIPEQLAEGIRMLDVRIKVKGHYPNYSFATCHGNILGGALKFNEYQSFQSVLDECSAFLKNHPSEFIIMMLKTDDWDGKNYSMMHAALDSLLFSKQTNYPIYDTNDPYLPTLGKLRGKIYLINRDYTFGVPLTFPINKADLVPSAIHFSFAEPDTDGLERTHYLRRYPVYIQDQFKKLAPHASMTKYDLVKETLLKKQKGDGEVVLNYTTARRGFMLLYKVYIQDSVLSYLNCNRNANFGWIMLDYENWTYPTDKYGYLNLIKVIISSNFQYADYPEKFKVLTGRHDQ